MAHGRRTLLANTREQGAIVLLVSLSILAVSDPLAMAVNLDGILLVGPANRMCRQDLRRAAAPVGHGAICVVGVALISGPTPTRTGAIPLRNPTRTTTRRIGLVDY